MISIRLASKIQQLEADGWEYERNYLTGKHSLEEVWIKRTEDEFGRPKTLLKYIEDGKLKDYWK